MNTAEFTAIFEQAQARWLNLISLKGNEYAEETDCLQNFYRNARDMRLSPLQIWRVYCGKHWDAINTFLLDEVAGRSRERSESITGRVDDMVVYLILLLAILEEERRAKEKA